MSRSIVLSLCVLLVATGTATAQTSLFCPADNPPIPALPIVTVADFDRNGSFDQKDINVALAQCDMLGGCNLQFLATTYTGVRFDVGSFPNGFAMYGQGQGTTVLQSHVYQPGDTWDHVVEITPDAPDGLVIQNLTIDGMRHSQPTPSVLPGVHTDHGGIQTAHSGSEIREDGLIQCVEVREMVANGGIMLGKIRDWVVQDNWIHDLGCHQIDSPCPKVWDLEPDVDGVPNRKTNGFGILVLPGAYDTVVQRNTVTEATKVGIQLFSGTALDCDDPRNSYGTQLLYNTVRESAFGIGINGGCEATIAHNLAEDMIATGHEASKIGSGFECRRGGKNSSWIDNASRNNQGAGYRIECKDGGLLIEDNYSANNCTTTTVTNFADVDLRPDYGTDPADAAGVQLLDHRGDAPNNCGYGIAIRRRNDVLVDGGEIQAGTLFGIRAWDGEGINVENITVHGGPVGMRIDTGLSNFFVQPSATFPGATTEFVFATGGPNDEDDVAYCAAESWPTLPNPQCCENYFVDVVCNSLLP